MHLITSVPFFCRALVVVLVVALVALVALAWWFPARLAWQWVAADFPAVYAGRVSGTVWHGRVEGLVVAGQRLGTLRWTLGRAAVFGDVHGSIDLRGASVIARGRIKRVAADTVVIKDAHFTLPVARLRALWPSGVALDGYLQGTIASARLVGGWPVRLDAQIDWRDAVIVDRGQRVALGDWTSRWQASGGTVVTGTLRDAGDGAVGGHGTFTATALGWRLDATLTPRNDEPALARLLSRFGTRTPDGRIRIVRRGGLMLGAAQ